MRRFPLATFGLVLATVLAYGAELGAGVEPFCLRYGFQPEAPTFGAALVSLFLHAGFAHLLGNGAALLLLGAIVESEIGPGRLVALFLSAGLAGAALHALLAPAGSVLVGASGGILGLLPASMVLRPPALLSFGVVFVCMHLAALFGTELFPASTSLACHVAGFIAGSAFVFARAARFGARHGFT